MSDAKADAAAAHRAERLWLGVLFLGLCSEALALTIFSPGTFMVFAVVGVPMCLCTALYFGVRGIRALMRRGLL